jgi:DNA polymerase III delta prime subunit
MGRGCQRSPAAPEGKQTEGEAMTREEAKEFCYRIVGLMMTDKDKYTEEAIDAVLSLEKGGARRSIEILKCKAEWFEQPRSDFERGAYNNLMIVAKEIGQEFGLEEKR